MKLGNNEFLRLLRSVWLSDGDRDVSTIFPEIMTSELRNCLPEELTTTVSTGMVTIETL